MTIIGVTQEDSSNSESSIELNIFHSETSRILHDTLLNGRQTPVTIHFPLALLT